MAPEFVPFILCAALIVATLVGFLVTGVLWASRRLRNRIWPLPMVSLIGSLGLAVVSGFCSRAVYLAYFLGEPMAVAACEGRLEVVRSYLDRGAPANTCDIDCIHPALVCAVQSGNADVVGLLLDHGASARARDIDGLTALDHARKRQNADIVRILEQAERR